MNEAPRKVQRSFKEILHATTLLGGASAVTMGMGVVRSKCVALLLGPQGVGLIAMYTQVVNVVATASGLGISISGVRSMAAASGNNDMLETCRVAKAIETAVWITGMLGAVALFAASRVISQYTFGDSSHFGEIRWLSGGVLIMALTAGQAAQLQGRRRLADLARINVYGALVGTILGVLFIVTLRNRGIVGAILAGLSATLLISWMMSRRVSKQEPVVRSFGGLSEIKRLVRSGVNFMLAILVSMVTAYSIQLVLMRNLSLEKVGLYQAAMLLSGVFVNFVLGAMGTDYYPSLAAARDDHVQMRDLINKQSQVSLFIALPVLCCLMVLASPVISIAYSATFVEAAPVLQWALIGVLGRVLSWPLGYVLMAKDRGRVYLATQIMSDGLNVAATYLGVISHGIVGAGIGFAITYVVYLALIMIVVRRLIGSVWTPSTRRIASWSGGVLLLLLGMSLLADKTWISLVICAITCALVMWLCVSKLLSGLKASYSGQSHEV